MTAYDTIESTNSSPIRRSADAFVPNTAIMGKSIRSKIMKKHRTQNRKDFGEAWRTKCITNAQTRLRASMQPKEEGSGLTALRGALGLAGASEGSAKPQDASMVDDEEAVDDEVAKAKAEVSARARRS